MLTESDTEILYSFRGDFDLENVCLFVIRRVILMAIMENNCEVIEAFPID